MERSEELWRRAHTEAITWARRFPDAWTRNHQDDLAQEASLAAWQWAGEARHRERFWAAVHTIAARIRGRARRSPTRVHVSQALVVAAVARDAAPAERHYHIAGLRVAQQRAAPWLQAALARLKPIDRELLLAFYEGFCCAELAERFQRSPTCVKTRLHRARRRIRREVEAHARTAGSLDS
jgi:RNA polymerase sigma factor (sigma-70 family)